MSKALIMHQAKVAWWGIIKTSQVVLIGPSRALLRIYKGPLIKTTWVVWRTFPRPPRPPYREACLNDALYVRLWPVSKSQYWYAPLSPSLCLSSPRYLVTSHLSPHSLSIYLFLSLCRLSHFPSLFLSVSLSLSRFVLSLLLVLSLACLKTNNCLTDPTL